MEHNTRYHGSKTPNTGDQPAKKQKKAKHASESSSQIQTINPTPTIDTTQLQKEDSFSTVSEEDDKGFREQEFGDMETKAEKGKTSLKTSLKTCNY